MRQEARIHARDLPCLRQGARIVDSTLPFCDKEQESSHLLTFFEQTRKNHRICLFFLRRQGRIIASTYFFCAGKEESLNLPSCFTTASKNPCAKATFLATSDQNPCAKVTRLATAKNNPCAKAFPPPIRGSCTLNFAFPRL